jgi:single-strand selective monofunctional uracil DNA glycosylase
MSLTRIAGSLRRDLAKLRFGPPITHVYNPLDYARAANEQYVTRYGTPGKQVVLIGMNPGPWGMAQTGVPFGEVGMVRDWLGISARVRQPASLHPKRPVLGFACSRSEVSGARLWGWARDTFQTPQRFFEQFFVANFCPLAFFDAAGRNITPDKLRATERAALEAVCEAALRRTIEHLSPRFVIGVGAYAESRARSALEGMDVTVGRILHPSPASPAANRGWSAQVGKQLRALGVELPT